MRLSLEKKKKKKKKKNIAASSDGGPKPMQTPTRWHQESGAQRAHAFTVTP